MSVSESSDGGLPNVDKADQATEKRGKSWRREREKRQQAPPATAANKEENAQLEISSTASENENNVVNGTSLLAQSGTESGAESTRPEEILSESAPSDMLPATEIVEVIPDKKAIEEEERRLLDEYIADIQHRFQVKSELRMTNRNAAANRPEETFFSKLDSNLRRNTAFVKKLKNFTEVQKDALMKDMQGLNLTKYIGEVAAAIVEAKLKMSDIGAAIQICSALHQRYAEFPIMMLEHWQKMLSLRKDDKVTNPSKLRVDLRFYAELISAGVFTHKEGLPLLGNLLTLLVNVDKDEHNNLSIILSFCKHCGEDYAGLVPKKIYELSVKYARQIPRSDLLTVERQKNVRILLKEYYASLCKHLLKNNKDIQSMDRQNRRILQTKGELNSDRREKYEAAQIFYQKLLSSTQQFSDIIGEEMPDLPIDELAKQDSESGSLDFYTRFKNAEFQLDGDALLWEDDDAKGFYENLQDLKSCIPGILFKENAPATAEPIEKPTEQENQIMSAEDTKEKSDEFDSLLLESEEKQEVVAEFDVPGVPDIEVPEAEVEPEVTGSTTNKVLLETFLNSLLRCINRETIDKAAVEFCISLNTKPNRRRLVRALFLVPRTRLDLLPFYARLVATLHPCVPDVATDLAAMLKQDFKYHVKKKDQINIESKVKTVRFIGELVKFKMFAKTEVLHCLKMLLFEFTHHHIEMACNIFETCGRYLFRSIDSHQRTKVYLEQMMRKKAVMPMDSRYTTMIENAFYYCNPPEGQQSHRKERTPMQEYIRKLLYKDLNKNNTEKVLRQMRKLDWECAEIAFYSTKCLTAIWNVKYYNIRCIANLLAGLVAHQENIGPQVVDGVLEDIRLGMEINLPKYNQRRVSAIRFLGELYNYRMVESAVVFKMLYSLITFGITYDKEIYSVIDPPDHLLRIRLVCILLETCGQYFNSGSSKKKLDCFITYFQRYYWFKKSHPYWNDDNPFPIHTDYMVKDTLQVLRAKLKLAENYEEASKNVEELEKELMSRLAEILPTMCAKEGSVSSDGQDALEPICETDEDDNEEDGHSTAVSDAEHDLEHDDEMEVTGESQSQPLEAEDNENGEVDADRTGTNDGEDFCLGVGPKHINCREDDDFLSAFDKMMADNIQHRNQENVRAPQIEIMVPINAKSTLKKMYTNLDAATDESSIVSFILVTRKGNKQNFKSLQVPLTSELARHLKDREEAERAEKERVKKLTLDINERQEEEDYQEMLAVQQRPAVMNLNRERRQKYQHPKGAPDADIIFGNKKR